MTLKQLLEELGLGTALIIDDGYDKLPQPTDLAQAEWTNFFADLNESERATLTTHYRNYDKENANDLKNSTEFVSILWNARDSFRPAQRAAVFGYYEHTLQTERQYLSDLEKALTDLGVKVSTSGRNLSDKRDEAIVFVDLFLGAEQVDFDMRASIDRLQKLMQGREERPPLIILMSRSDRLESKRTEFRDGVPLLATMFRVHTKEQLLDGVSLERTLHRLAKQYEDARRLARFLGCWEEGLIAAKSRFMTTVRRLDLADYCQIHQLLLEFEGQPLGSYVLDIFDRVMQHELEAHRPTIDAAEALNQINTERFSPPHIAGSPDLQTLIYRSIFQHHERLRITSNVGGSPVAFGDVLVRRSLLGESQPQSNPDDEALIVLTAACDLVRAGTKRVMLLAGKIEVFNQNAWTRSAEPKTPIVILPNGDRVWIRWDLKDVQMKLHSELSVMLAESGSHRVQFRLRESHALELQQKLLADIGRVGVLATMPATFAFSVTAFSLNAEGLLVQLNTPILAAEGAVCFALGKHARLVLSDSATDELCKALRAIDSATAHTNAQEALKLIKSSNAFPALLEQLSVPPLENKGLSPLKIPKLDGAGKQEKDKDEKLQWEGTVGFIGHHPPPPSLKGNPAKGAGFILILGGFVGDPASYASPVGGAVPAAGGDAVPNELVPRGPLEDENNSARVAWARAWRESLLQFLHDSWVGIRRRFLRYFRHHNYAVVPSSSPVRDRAASQSTLRV